MPPLFVVVRHGERSDGRPGAAPATDPPLTEEGRGAVAGLASMLSESLGPRAPRVRIVSSPFRRTLETAQLLVECGIGAAVEVDCTLCEVFGPIRIKGGVPRINVSRALGSLPVWGETLEAASRRFARAFTSICADSPDGVVMVTHGDAIAAILADHYPQRTVYSCDYLGFLSFQKFGNRFVLIHHDRVSWLTTDAENESEAKSSPTLLLEPRISAPEPAIRPPSPRGGGHKRLWRWILYGFAAMLPWIVAYGAACDARFLLCLSMSAVDGAFFFLAVVGRCRRWGAVEILARAVAVAVVFGVASGGVETSQGRAPPPSTTAVKSSRCVTAFCAGIFLHTVRVSLFDE